MTTSADDLSGAHRDVISQLRNGNEGVFRELFNKYYMSLVEFANRYVRESASAEDVVCDVFAKLWENREHLHLNTTLRAYLFGAVRNRSLNLVRDAGIAKGIIARHGIDLSELSYRPVSPDKKLSLEESLLALKESLSILGETERTILRLRWAEQLNWEEIASVVQVSVAAAQMKHARALRTIKARLEDY